MACVRNIEEKHHNKASGAEKASILESQMIDKISSDFLFIFILFLIKIL